MTDRKDYMDALRNEVSALVPGATVEFDSTPLLPAMEDPEAYRLYRLCECGECHGEGKDRSGKFILRCKTCRGEGKTLDLVATCGSPEAVGVALCTLASENEFDECPVGIMHRPEGEKGKWLIKPWLPSARNVSDAGRTLAKHKTAGPTGPTADRPTGVVYRKSGI